MAADSANGSVIRTAPSDFGTIRRSHGTKQVTYDGHRLYTFKDDTAPMTANGDGAADDFDGQHFTWHAATTDAAAGSGGAATTPGGTQASSTPTTAGY